MVAGLTLKRELSTHSAIIIRQKEIGGRCVMHLRLSWCGLLAERHRDNCCHVRLWSEYMKRNAQCLAYEQTAVNHDTVVIRSKNSLSAEMKALSSMLSLR